MRTPGQGGEIGEQPGRCGYRNSERRRAEQSKSCGQPVQVGKSKDAHASWSHLPSCRDVRSVWHQVAPGIAVPAGRTHSTCEGG
jgi:hypothetical protein